jgi:hypothetical protein
MILYIQFEYIIFILYISPSCQTLSKAWLMSRNAALQYLLFTSAKFMTLVNDELVQQQRVTVWNWTVGQVQSVFIAMLV